MIDLTGQSQLVLLLDFDGVNSTVTVTIKDPTEVTTFGVLKMDQTRLRPFVEALGVVARNYYDDHVTETQHYKMTLDTNQQRATVAFG